MNSYKIAYIVVSGKKDGSYRGGIMVVDRRGLPLEFHYSEKVNPTKIQKVIYGNVLEKFIKENILSENLYKALKNKPDLIITADRDFEVDDTSFAAPVIFLEKTKVEPLITEREYQEFNDESVLFQAQRYKNPLMVRFLNVKKEDQLAVMDLITLASESLDLLEPLSRIEEALVVAEKEKQAKEENDGG